MWGSSRHGNILNPRTLRHMGGKGEKQTCDLPIEGRLLYIWTMAVGVGNIAKVLFFFSSCTDSLPAVLTIFYKSKIIISKNNNLQAGAPTSGRDDFFSFI